ncbi:MAG: argininosuccinate synthase [Phycisphaerales bacterium]|nr:argininosuccinate synthase [Phycisphaerales bacterium]MCI0632155.1 argininosuccinate synthase [Phycisphaerales bacterium]MCI0675011.1 argininosuccinate synthase [Phycisphaerales bacterium]
MPKKVVLAYSGGLDTSAIMPWLKENYECDVVAFVGDVGQGDAELEGVEEKAINSGASACHIVDLKREFVDEYVYPTILSGAIYEGRYLLGTSIARPVLAKGQVEIARKVGADAVAHGCTGKGNDQVRFESAFAALAPDLEVIAPWREWDLKSRSDLINYIRERGIPCSASLEKIYSRDRNLWHISHEGGELEDPWNAPPDDVWVLTNSVAQAPDAPEDVQLKFERGKAVALNGKTMPSEELIAELNKIGGKHAVGRVDIVENRLVGMKSRGCYETPGGTILVEALRGLEQLVYDRQTLHYREQIALKFAELVYDGQWFTPLREALWAAVQKMAERMTGEVVVRLHKGGAQAVKRRSPNSLFSVEFATFDKDEVYNQAHAEGFIRLFSLPARIAALNAGVGKKSKGQTEVESKRASGPKSRPSAKASAPKRKVKART